jgi:hypothetical protein
MITIFKRGTSKEAMDNALAKVSGTSKRTLGLDAY